MFEQLYFPNNIVQEIILYKIESPSTKYQNEVKLISNNFSQENSKSPSGFEEGKNTFFHCYSCWKVVQL